MWSFFSNITTDLFIIFLVSFMVILFRKYILHFKILKSLYPDKFTNIDSFFNPLTQFIVLTLNFKTQLWYNCPIYFNKSKIDLSNCDVLVQKLKKNNFYFLYLLIFLLIILILNVLLQYIY